MSFGSPAPVEVLVIGPERETVRTHTLRILDEMEKIPSLRDVQIYQQLDYPTLQVDIDRQKAGLSGVAVTGVTDACWSALPPAATWSRNYSRNPKSGVDYQVQVQIPIQRMNRPQQVETLPIAKVGRDSNLLDLPRPPPRRWDCPALNPPRWPRCCWPPAIPDRIVATVTDVHIARAVHRHAPGSV